MRKLTYSLIMVCLWGAAVSLGAQTTSGTITGSVVDAQLAIVPGATVTARNLATDQSRSVLTDEFGRFRLSNVPIGTYEVKVELTGFGAYVQSGVTVGVNQEAVLSVTLQPAGIVETVTVQEDAPPINTSNAEIGVRFDTRRIAELPLATNRNIFNIALSAPGVSQIGEGQSGFATGTNFSVNGMRLRSNNFMIDGQDSNDPSITGRQQPMNNPDIVQEIQLITNQFAAEYGRAAGSVMNVVTKSGTNDFHGTAFWFHNDNALNSRNNLDERTTPKAPFRIENQFGGTFGGPIVRGNTFFFGSYQRWTDRRQGSGTTLNGAPMEQGRQVLQNAVGARPHVAALLKFLPAAQTPIGRNATFTSGGQTFTVPLGSLTGSSARKINNDQFSTRIDHQFGQSHTLAGRYLFTNERDAGGGQVTPTGLTTIVPSRQQAANIWLTSTLSGRAVNEARAAWQRLGSTTTAENVASQEIPSMEISELGLTGFNAGFSRTAIGLAVNLPQFRFNNTYQLQDNFSYIVGKHALKFGVDIRQIEVKSFFLPTIRGLVRYSSLQRFVDDVADAANINKPLPGGRELQYYQWHDVFLYAQDAWKVTDSFNLSLGLRYETPGNSVGNLVKPNEGIVAAAGGNPAFRFAPVPKRDVNNFQPRFGFNWNPRTGPNWLTGGHKFVLRGGYSHTNDYAFININLNIASAFPFVGAVTLPATTQPTGAAGVTSAFTRLGAAAITGDPMQFTRTIVGEDFRSPYADQFSLEMQRELTQNLVFRVGYVGTKGTALFQTLDGNPIVPGTRTRVDPGRGVIRLRANAASSIYHSLQVSADKRLSNGFSAGIHYTWSRFIDTASEIFNAATSGDVAVSQDSFNRYADRGLSTYDRTHRFTGNFVYEFPWYRGQPGAAGRLLGGWQINSFFTFQSGAPFSALNGADPAGALSGIDALVGNAIRPNLNTTLDISSMKLDEILAAGGRSLFSTLPTSGAIRVGNVGRNTLRADGIGNVDLGIIKNTRIGEGHNLQFRVEMYNATNTRNFGIPEGRVNSANFLNQWGTDGGNRRVIAALRYVF